MNPIQPIAWGCGCLERRFARRWPVLRTEGYRVVPLARVLDALASERAEVCRHHIR